MKCVILSPLLIFLTMVSCSHQRNSGDARGEVVGEEIEPELYDDENGEEYEGQRCYSPNSCDDYFSTVPVEEIQELSMHNILFKTDYITDDYRGLGTYDEPEISNDMMYVSKSDLSVIVSGYVSVSDAEHAANTQIVDSVTISYFIVLRKNHHAERYSNNSYYNGFDKPWKDCPVPMADRDKIRQDFLTRMKYRTYHIKTDLRKPPVYYAYTLKNQIP